MRTPEQEARDLLDEMGIEGAQSFSSGEVVWLANLIADHRKALKAAKRWWFVRTVLNDPATDLDLAVGLLAGGVLWWSGEVAEDPDTAVDLWMEHEEASDG